MAGIQMTTEVTHDLVSLKGLVVQDTFLPQLLWSCTRLLALAFRSPRWSHRPA